jgi:hypothetical protein
MSQQPIGFERWEPGHPWGDVVYSDGSKTSVMDPDGSIEAEARQYGARYSSMPRPAATPTIEPALSGAASPPLPPSTASPPPMPNTRPLSDAERQQVAPTPEELKTLGQGLPSTDNPVAKALAENGVDPSSLRRAAPAGAAPAAPSGAPAAAAPAGALDAVTAAVQEHAPHLLPAKAQVQYEGPDGETRRNVQGASDMALQQKGQAITEGVEAKALNLQDQGAAANQAYFEGWQRKNQAMGEMGALTKARDAAAAKLATAKQTPVADHPDFPDWFVATSILGSIAGGFAEGFSGGKYKSTTLPMLQDIVRDWRETQKYNKGNLISSLEQQLGDSDAALNAGGARVKDALADMAESQAKFARTVEARRELESTAAGLRASALEDWSKTQALVMGKEGANLSMAAPKVTAVTNDTKTRLKALGVDQKLWERALGEPIKDGRQNAPSVAQTAASLKQIDADVMIVKSLAEANGGTLPTRGAIKIPDVLVPTLSRLGYSPGMEAEQVGQILGGYVMQRARSYGGAVTESDAAAAEKETGKSTAGVMRYLERLRNQSNRALSTELARFFPGNEQAVLDILLERSSEGVTPGVPEATGTPFEKENRRGADRNTLGSGVKQQGSSRSEPLSREETIRRAESLYGRGPLAPLAEPFKTDPALEHGAARRESGDDLLDAYDKRGD